MAERFRQTWHVMPADLERLQSKRTELCSQRPEIRNITGVSKSL